MLEKLREVLHVKKIYRGNYYHLLKDERFNEEGNYTENSKCRYCKYSCLDGSCEYYHNKYNLKVS